MNILFDFLDEDAIENIITCLEYKLDKVIYFGSNELIKLNRSRTKYALLNICNVDNVEFCAIESENLDVLIESLERVILKELIPTNHLFFDVTGGEGLNLVAFGMLSQKHNLALHMYDILSGELTQLNNIGYTLDQCCKKQNIKLDLSQYIRMQGGIINQELQKDCKNVDNPELVPYIDGLWSVVKKYAPQWNMFSNFLKNEFDFSDRLDVQLTAQGLISLFRNSSSPLFNKPCHLFCILDDLEKIGAVENVIHKNGRFAFKFKNHSIKKYILENGCILELHTYMEESKHSDYCAVGVHIDWDGIIHGNQVDINDVLNEIDVLSITNNIAHFISCKCGNLNANKAMQALYELSTVAKRFGGKYSKMTLATCMLPRPTDIERATQMNIEICCT